MEERVRKALGSIDPDLVLYSVDSYKRIFSADFQQENMIATLTMLFGALGLTLAAVGLYGVMAYMVEQRTGEIGVRMALGANRSHVLRMILGNAFSQVGIWIGPRHSGGSGSGQTDDRSVIRGEAVGSIHDHDCGSSAGFGGFAGLADSGISRSRSGAYGGTEK